MASKEAAANFALCPIIFFVMASPVPCFGRKLAFCGEVAKSIELPLPGRMYFPLVSSAPKKMFSAADAAWWKKKLFSYMCAHQYTHWAYQWAGIRLRNVFSWFKLAIVITIQARAFQNPIYKHEYKHILRVVLYLHNPFLCNFGSKPWSQHVFLCQSVCWAVNVILECLVRLVDI